MSRYTDLMKKSERTFNERQELFKLVLEEYDREERRLSKLPIDAKTRQESLWNVIDAHQDILENQLKEYGSFLNVDDFGDDATEGRMWKEYNNLQAYRSRQERTFASKGAFDGNIISTGVSQNESEETQTPEDPKEDKTPVQLDEETRQFLNMKEWTVISKSDLVDGKNALSMKKCDYAYSVAGDKTITPEQRKAIYQFHHWMRKHNATAKLKWAGLGYKGSAVDFSERFMRLPARVQLKALYLVETNNRKRPHEEIDNAVSQDYVPDYDKLKKRMTSNFLFVRKYLNGSRYFWHKLEQAANLANEEKSVEKLRQFTDAKKENPDVKASQFFLPKDNAFGFLKQLRAQVEQASLDLEHGENGKSPKQKKEELKERKDALRDYALLVKSICRLTEFKETQADTNGKLGPEAQKKLEDILQGIENVRKKLLENKRFLEDYQNYFNRQSGDLAGYSALGTGLGTAMYELITNTTSHPYIGASVSLATLPTALMNCIDAVRTMFNGADAAEKTMGVMDFLSSTAVMGSKGITAANLVTEVGSVASNVGMYLGTGAFGVSTAVNAVKSIRSHGKMKKADDLYKSFTILDANLQKEIDQLKTDDKTKEIADDLEKMKRRTLWTTLDHASKLIKHDKKREYRSNLRRLAASALSCISNAVGYVGNTILSWCGVGGSALGGVGGTINDMRDNVLEKRRNKEYIETEYPITNGQRIAAISNYRKQLENYQAGSTEWKEIWEILSDKEKLDNRIRNMQAGNHVRANQEGLRNAIYQQYSDTIAKEASQFNALDDDGATPDLSEQKIPVDEDRKEKKSRTAEYEKQARQLMTGYSDLLKLKKTEEKKQVKAEREDALWIKKNCQNAGKSF